MDSKSLDCLQHISRNMDVNNFAGEDSEEVRKRVEKILSALYFTLGFKNLYHTTRYITDHRFIKEKHGFIKIFREWNI